MGDGEVGIKQLNGGLQSILLFLSICAIVVPCTLGFVNLDKRQDILEGKHEAHEVEDKSLWQNVHDDIDENLSSIHTLELQNTRLETQFSEIMRRLDELNLKLDRFEVL
jgi:hypothetical protein